MPFLIPALIALPSDALVLYLSRLDAHAAQREQQSIPQDEEDKFVYKSGYLVPLALLRIFLLCVPLLFRSYTGTVLKCPHFYQILYWGTAMVVSLHMLALSLLNPESLESLLPTTTDTTLLVTATPTLFKMTDNDTDYTSTDHSYPNGGGSHRFLYEYQDGHHRMLLQHLHQLRRLWWMLIATLVADICHLFLLWHVRSTAPVGSSYYAMLLRQGRKQPSTVYFALRSADRRQTGHSPYHHHNVDESDNDNNNLHRYSRHDEYDGIETTAMQGTNEDENALMHAMNEFVVDVQTKLHRAKEEWAKRLEDFTGRLSNNSTHNNLNCSAQNQVVRMGGPHSSIPNPLSVDLTPFRVLLQLFAYEEVLDNGKMDVVFEMDDGARMTFFVPQLLSFLLHGATLDLSPRLEEWILEKCQVNIYFAHRCYWFLRAWCLEVPSEPAPGHQSGLGGLPQRRNSEGFLNSVASASASAAGSGNGVGGSSHRIAPAPASSPCPPLDGLAPFLDQPASPERNIMDCQFIGRGSGSSLLNTTNNNSQLSSKPDTFQPPSSQQQHQLSQHHRQLSSSSASRLGGIFRATQQSVSEDKFFPQERAMIELLMLRVKERGEEPAYKLEYGNHSVNTAHVASASTPVPAPPVVQSADASMVASSPLGTLSHVSFLSDDDDDYGLKVEHEFEQQRQQENQLQRSPRSVEHSEAVTGETMKRNNTFDDSDNSEDWDLEVAIRKAVESGKIPVDPTTGYASENHVASVIAKHKHGFTPIPLEPPPSAPMGNSNGLYSTYHHPFPNHDRPRFGETEHFDKTPRFLDSLICLADGLFLVPREHRKTELRRQLQALECELLPSNVIYLPIRNVNHRVWRFVPEESIPISTKERVPCIICMEVVDYTPRRRERRSWSFLDRRRPVRVTSNDAASVDSACSTPNSVKGIEPIFSYDEAAEADIINEWRYARRDPLRRISLLDKMTTTVRDSVKGPLSKMRSQMQDKFKQLRDRSVSEELRSLTLAEALVEDQPQELVDFVPCLETENLGPTGSGNAVDALESGIGRPSLSRASSGASMASMGQWSATPVKDAVTPKMGSPSKARKSSINDLRRRIDRDGLDRVDGLTYGSDHEQDRDRRRDSLKSRRAPAGPSRPVDLTSPKASSDTKTKPPPVVFRESWQTKQDRIRKRSIYGAHPGWRLLPILIKANDDLRQEQLCSQLIYRMASILAREKVPVWLCPYEILALTDRGGIIEAIPDTISLDSLKRNNSNFSCLKDFFLSHFGEGTDELTDAKANFVESLAGYSIVCFLLQIKDRHNGNILIDKSGHLIHIDFGFFFLSSPGKNVGFESAPFKLTRDFVEVLDGPDSHLFKCFRELCVRTFITLRRHCMEIILLVEMLKNGNEGLKCFRGRPDDAIAALRERFRLDLNDRACREYVQSLIDDSIENWRTDWYDRYQRYFVGVL